MHLIPSCTDISPSFVVCARCENQYQVRWSTSCSGGEENGETLQAGWDLLCGSFLAASHSKGGTAAKSSRLKDVIQGVE